MHNVHSTCNDMTSTLERTCNDIVDNVVLHAYRCMYKYFHIVATICQVHSYMSIDMHVEQVHSTCNDMSYRCKYLSFYMQRHMLHVESTFYMHIVAMYGISLQCTYRSRTCNVACMTMYILHATICMYNVHIVACRMYISLHVERYLTYRYMSYMSIDCMYKYFHIVACTICTSTFYMQRYDKYVLHATMWQVHSTCNRLQVDSTCISMHVEVHVISLHVECTCHIVASRIYMHIDCKYNVHAYRYDK